MNQEPSYSVKVQNGEAVLYNNDTGSLHRKVGANIVSAQVNGDKVQCTRGDGRIEIREVKSGNVHRII